MGDCSKHPRMVPGFDNIDQVVSAVYMLNKDLTVELFSELSLDYANQSFADNEGGRVKLAAFLRETSYYLLEATSDLKNVSYLSAYNNDFLPSQVFSIKKWAFDIGNLQYDVSVEFFSKCSALLPFASKNISKARLSLQEAWNISEPYMS